MAALRAGMALAGAGLILVSGLVALPPRGFGELDPSTAGSLRITDRNGTLLRELPTGGRRARRGLAELPPWVPAALVAAEDRRFFAHPGVDPAALARAAAANARAGHVVSGGSTITQQLARLLLPAPRRTPLAKALELLDAARLEQRLTKPQILEQYLNRVAFGRGAVGIESAALAWFGHSARTLSPGEAAGSWCCRGPRHSTAGRNGARLRPTAACARAAHAARVIARAICRRAEAPLTSFQRGRRPSATSRVAPGAAARGSRRPHVAHHARRPAAARGRAAGARRDGSPGPAGGPAGGGRGHRQPDRRTAGPGRFGRFLRHG
jgi:membrane carboxypeptidase/penicillin-binding protein PbpC